jgi:hypothetical protein
MQTLTTSSGNVRLLRLATIDSNLLPLRLATLSSMVPVEGPAVVPAKELTIREDPACRIIL